MKASATNYKSESDVQGKPAPVAGKYHMDIASVNDTRRKKDGGVLPYTIVEYEVLNGTVPGQEGKKVTQFIELDENGNETADYIEKATRLCLAAGILKPGEERDVDAKELEHCQVVVGVEVWESKKTKKSSTGVGDYGMAIWSVDNADVADVPKNKDAIRLWKEGNGQAVAGGNGHAGPGSTATTSTTAPSATAGSTSDNFDDI